MLVFTIDFAVMRSMVRSFNGQYFFLDAGDSIEMYSPTREGILLRSVYRKRSEGEDMLFIERYLKDATRIEDVENLTRGNESMGILARIESAVNDIRTMISSLIEEDFMKKANKDIGMEKD